MKCDGCYYKTGYILGADECGAGHWMGYCAKGHWAGGDTESEEETVLAGDPWEDCKDHKAEPSKPENQLSPGRQP